MWNELLTSLFLICNTLGAANSAAEVHTCFSEQRRIINSYGSISSKFSWFPRCMAGGYFEHVQCDLMGCYCAYVDSGRQIPETIEHAYLPYMIDNCPILSNEMPDPCTSPPSDYPCKEKSNRYYYNSNSDKCEANVHSCLGFDTMNACRESCVVKRNDRCNFKQHSGKECGRREAGERWYHDENQGKCRPFLYNGCGGNSNNYKEKWICLKTCESDLSIELIIQVSAMKYIIKLRFWLVVQLLLVPSVTNKLTVEQFKQIEGHMEEISKFPVTEGREGQVTAGPPTETTTLPEILHGKNVSNKAIICAAPSDPGPCRAYFRRWYFSAEKSKCLLFIYGGCAGNENNFEYSTQCAEFCDAKIKPSEAELLEEKLGLSGIFGVTTTKAPTTKNNEKPEKPATGERSLEIGGIPPDLGGEPKEKPKEVEKQSEAEIDFVLGGDSP